jgi:hypothetical protein
MAESKERTTWIIQLGRFFRRNLIPIRSQYLEEEEEEGFSIPHPLTVPHIHEGNINIGSANVTLLQANSRV